MSLPSSPAARIAELEARVASLEGMLSRRAQQAEPTVITTRAALQKANAKRERLKATALGIAAAIAMASATVATWTFLIDRRAKDVQPLATPAQPVAVTPTAPPVEATP